jgi:hypothetical protein
MFLHFSFQWLKKMNSRADTSDRDKSIANPDSITRDDLGIENQQDDGWEMITKKNRNRSGPPTATLPVPASVRQPTPYASSTPQPRRVGNGSGRGHNGSRSGFVNMNPKSSVNQASNSGPNPSPLPVTPDPRKPVSWAKPQHLPPQQAMPAPKPGVQPPLAGWADRVRIAGPQPNVEVAPLPPDFDPENNNASDDDDDDDDLAADSDDDLTCDSDSDASQKSHGTRKQSKWFKAFFDELDG